MTLRESIRNHAVTILLINEVKKEFFTTIKEGKGQYTLILDDLGNDPITFGTTVRVLPFIHQKNQVNFDSLSRIVIFLVLFIIGIISLTPRVVGICIKDE